MRISLAYLGCKVNQAEIVEMERQLLRQGHEIVQLHESPEICVVNTCTVTARSDYQSRQLIRKAARTGARVIATGCYAEMNKEDIAQIEGVSTVLPNSNKSSLIKLINPDKLESGLNYNTALRARYLLKVQDGCNNSCSYCIVWKARGKSRSIAIQDALDMASYAVDQGFNEIVLTGIHLGTYGADIGVSLADLIETLLTRTSIKRLRLSSLEVGEIDNRLVGLMASEPRLCRHLHIPLQSADDEVLRSMGRSYTAGDFRDRVLELREMIGDMALGTDIISGYPTETAQAHDNNIKLATKLPFTYMHVFPYSTRPNTTAAALDDIVGNRLRKQRSDELRSIAIMKKAAYMQKQIGKRLTLLIERRDGGGGWIGTTGNYLKALVSVSCAPDIKRGSLLNIEVSGLQADYLVGNPVYSP